MDAKGNDVIRKRKLSELLRYRKRMGAATDQDTRIQLSVAKAASYETQKKFTLDDTGREVATLVAA